MRVGITLPQFRPSAEPALEAARAAEAAGLDGVFVFDHVFAIGEPDRPALNAWPMLGALATETRDITLGTLVARVSLLQNAVLAHNMESVHRMIGGRLIAGLGAGDELSKPENDSVGVPFPPASERLADLADACRRTRSLGITTWVGGLSKKIREVALADADALNLWGVEPERVAEERDIEVTWGGQIPPDPDEAGDLLCRLRDAGATWAVCGPPYGRSADPRPGVEIVAVAATHLR